MKFTNEADIQKFWSGHPFRSVQLRSVCGKSVSILHPGFLNTGSGPDFFNASVRIDGVLWCGCVEIHAMSSQWFDHKHHQDPAYDNVVLHVVVAYDGEVSTLNGNKPVTLVLPDDLPRRRMKRLKTPADFSAEEFAVYRMKRKVAELRMLPEAVKGDTEALFHRLLFTAFGNHQNALPFENLAVVTPVNVIRRQRGYISDLEAVLYGQSGLLTSSVTDSYAQDLLLRYGVLRRKYSLIPMSAVGWKQKGMRPASFPCIRISQLSSVLHRQQQLMSELIYASSVNELQVMLQADAGVYWNTHFRFGQESGDSVKSTGITFINSVLINAVALFRWYCGELNAETKLCTSALDLLSALPAEKNTAVSKAGLECSNALMSQAVLELIRNHGC